MRCCLWSMQMIRLSRMESPVRYARTSRNTGFLFGLLMWSLGMIDWSEPQFDDSDDQTIHMANIGKSMLG